jgi:hypothetical protein
MMNRDARTLIRLAFMEVVRQGSSLQVGGYGRHPTGYLFRWDLPLSLVCLIIGRLRGRHLAHLTRLIWLTGLQLRSVLGVYE